MITTHRENLILTACVVVAALGLGAGLLFTYGARWLPRRVLAWLDDAIDDAIDDAVTLPEVTR